jgi:hypothetical protein
MRDFDGWIDSLLYWSRIGNDSEVSGAVRALKHLHQQKVEENERLNNLFRSTISALARIDVALGIEDDACNELEITLQVIEELKADAKRGQQLAVAVMSDNMGRG